MLHELFYRIQPDLGLITLSGQNAHLDTFEERVWLRLEWRALARALGQSGEDRRRLSDAAVFRIDAPFWFTNAAENERVEIREGLAQYTGIVARPTRALTQCQHDRAPAAAEGHETFLQQSYATGTAYGILLDDASADWAQSAAARRADADGGPRDQASRGRGRSLGALRRHGNPLR